MIVSMILIMLDPFVKEQENKTIIKVISFKFLKIDFNRFFWFHHVQIFV